MHCKIAEKLAENQKCRVIVRFVEGVQNLGSHAGIRNRKDEQITVMNFKWFPDLVNSDGQDHDRADHGGHARSWSDREDPILEWLMKLGSPDRVIDHGRCSSIIEYGRLLSTILEYDRFCAHQGLNIHSILILSIFARVITRIEEPYPIVHLCITVLGGWSRVCRSPDMFRLPT